MFRMFSSPLVTKSPLLVGLISALVANRTRLTELAFHSNAVGWEKKTSGHRSIFFVGLYNTGALRVLEQSHPAWLLHPPFKH